MRCITKGIYLISMLMLAIGGFCGPQIVQAQLLQTAAPDIEEVSPARCARPSERKIKPRLIVLTDISSLSQKEGEPDDGQSMIRLMLYSNDLDLEGLIATSNLGHGQRVRPELIRRVVNAYAAVRPNLLLHDKGFPSADYLRSIIKAGQPVAGRGVPVEQSIGEGRDTEAAEWIIDVVDRKDPRPVWVIVWGGSADLAQALWKIKATRTPAQLKEFVARLRVHAVYDQDSTGPWLRSNFPDLFYILRHHGIRGMYRGGDTALAGPDWVEANIRKDHGPLGALYVNYRGGDIWSRQLGRVEGIKEGDTPSFLYMLSNGLNNPERPEWGSWGGRFRRERPGGNVWVEAVDSVAGYETDPDRRMAALYRWRPAWQADFAARFDWCVKSWNQANHVPEIRKTAGRVKTTANKTVRIIAPSVKDPDRDSLAYKWYFYPEEGTYRGPLPKLNSQGREIRFIAPEVDVPRTLHLILEVTDNGQPALTHYQRFIITVHP